ncbi:MAG: hypothetical protein AB7K71_30025, partial [Polyangiaceae bacterium]
MARIRRRWLWLGVPAGLAGCAYWTYGGGQHEPAGTPRGAALPAAAISARIASQRSVEEPAQATKQILFGDLHVHSTFSPDAFMRTLPCVGGEGAHPPADAC